MFFFFFHLLGLSGRSALTTGSITTATETATTATVESGFVVTRGALGLGAATGAGGTEGRSLVLDLVGSLLEGVGDNGLREVEVGAEVGDTLGSEVPVVPAPVEGLSDVGTAVEGLHEADELAVGDLRDEVMLGSEEVLLGDEDALSEEVAVDNVSLLLGDDHFFSSSSSSVWFFSFFI